MTPSDKLRKRAEELERTLIDCANSDVTHCYKPGNERCHWQSHILQFAQEVREETREATIRECAKMAKKFGDRQNRKGIDYQYPAAAFYLVQEEILSLLSSETTEKKCNCQMVGSGEARGKLTVLCPIHSEEIK